MKKYIAPVLFAALALVVAYYGYHALTSLGILKPDLSAYVEKAKYDAAVKAGEAKEQAALATIAEKDKTIAAQTAKIAAILHSAAEPTQAEQAKDATIADLERRVAAFESQGDIKAALGASKAECRAWAEKFTLAEKRHADSIAALDVAWQAKFDEKDGQFKAAMSLYEQERALRLSCEFLNKKLMPKAWRKWATYGGYALAFVLGNIAGR